jgi:hypothetical protein
MLSNLRNVHGYYVMCYVACLLMSFVCLLVIQWMTDIIDSILCKLFGAYLMGNARYIPPVPDLNRGREASLYVCPRCYRYKGALVKNKKKIMNIPCTSIHVRALNFY